MDTHMLPHTLINCCWCVDVNIYTKQACSHGRGRDKGEMRSNAMSRRGTRKKEMRGKRVKEKQDEERQERRRSNKEKRGQEK